MLARAGSIFGGFLRSLLFTLLVSTVIVAGRPHQLPAACNGVGEAFVKFRDSVSPSEIESIHKQIGSEVIETVQGSHIQWVRARTLCDAELMRAFRDRPEVDWVQRAPNRMQ